MIRFFIY